MRMFEMENIEIDLVPLFLMAILIFSAIGVGYALLQYIYHIHSTGTVEAIGVVIKDENGNIITSINWGTLTPNSIATRHVFAVNNGTVPITLTLTTQNWNPSEAANYISLSWNYLGETINPGNSQSIILTLTVSASITGISSFSFDIVITAQEV